MKVEDVGAILDLKVVPFRKGSLPWRRFYFDVSYHCQGYFDRRHEVDSLLNLTKAKITRVQATGMGDRVCVDICSLMRPGEGLLVCSYFSVYLCLFTVYIWVHFCILLYGISISFCCFFLRLDPLQEAFSLFTLNAWSQITFLAGLFE